MGSDSIFKNLSMTFSNCQNAGYFPATWKKTNVIPFHKKRNKQILSNYRPFSLLRICGKLAEKIIFDTIFQHLKENNVLNPNQSEFFLAIPAYISLFQLPMEYMRLLMPIPHYMLEVLS